MSEGAVVDRLGHPASLARAGTRCQHPEQRIRGADVRVRSRRRGETGRGDRGRGRDGDGGRASALLARPRRPPAGTLHVRSRQRQLGRIDPELPADLPRPRVCPDGPAGVGAMASPRVGGRPRAPPGRRRARRGRGHRCVGSRPRGGRRILRTTLGGRGGRAVALLRFDEGVHVPVSARGSDHPGGRGDRGPGATRPRRGGGASRGDGRRLPSPDGRGRRAGDVRAAR